MHKLLTLLSLSTALLLLHGVHTRTALPFLHHSHVVIILLRTNFDVGTLIFKSAASLLHLIRVMICTTSRYKIRNGDRGLIVELCTALSKLTFSNDYVVQPVYCFSISDLTPVYQLDSWT